MDEKSYEIEMQESAEEAELRSLQGILDAFRRYELDSLKQIDRAEKMWRKVGERYLEYMPGLHDHLGDLRRCVRINHKLLARACDPDFLFCAHPKLEFSIDPIQLKVPRVEVDKVRSTLRQIVRDWSVDGVSEREQCYTPLLEELDKRVGRETLKDRIARVLVPGAGLGRLIWEIARRGFHAEGNEFSFYMLLVSNLFLNGNFQKDQFVIYPWIHQYSNVFSRDRQLHPVSVPDVSPRDISSSQIDFSMCAGDFLEVYNDRSEEFDVIISCFFLDTARNIIDYVELIWKLLRPGGYFFNIGPLLYHYEGTEREVSIEIPYEDLKGILQKLGFEILREEMRQCTYTSNRFSLMQVLYNAILLVCQKSADAPSLNSVNTQ